MAGLTVKLRIGGLETLHLFPRLDSRPMIDEMFHRDLLHDFLKPADVIAVIVRGYQKVDLLQTSVVDRGHDAVRIAPTRVARVHEQRLPGRRDIQSG